MELEMEREVRVGLYVRPKEQHDEAFTYCQLAGTVLLTWIYMVSTNLDEHLYPFKLLN